MNINKPKKTLVQDLTIIVILQFSALFYGINTIYTQRPVALAFYENKFFTVSANNLDDQGIDLNELKKFSKDSPAMVFVEKPADVEMLKTMLKIIREQQVPPIYQMGLYRPIQNHFPEILKWGVNIDDVIANNLDIANQLEVLLQETNTKQADNKYLIMESKYQNVLLVFNANKEMIGYLKAPYKTID